MEILFNCTTNIVGGGVKNSAIFIKHALERTEIKWKFAVSKPVVDILERWKINHSSIILFNASPARNIKARNRLQKLINEYRPDIVYTMAGPAYISSSQPHIMGISNPYITHGRAEAFLINKNRRELIKLLLSTCYQVLHARRADSWIFQTETARIGFIRRFKVASEKTHVIPNAIDNEFRRYFHGSLPHLIRPEQPVVFFCPAADYWHKALSCIPAIAKALRNLHSTNNKNFKFILTLPHDSQQLEFIRKKAEKYGVIKHIDNIGPYNYADAISLLEKADIVFAPSILETFSATYLEAFASKRPLIVADRDFARSICNGGALYIEPFSPQNSAQKINELIINRKLQKSLINYGLKILDKYGNQEIRIKNIISLLKRIKDNENLD